MSVNPCNTEKTTFACVLYNIVARGSYSFSFVVALIVDKVDMEPPDHNQARESMTQYPHSRIPHLICPDGVCPERNLPAKQVNLPSTSLHGTANSSVSLPPLLYKYLDINDTVHVSVFKSATIPSGTGNHPADILHSAATNGRS